MVFSISFLVIAWDLPKEVEILSLNGKRVAWVH